MQDSYQRTVNGAFSSGQSTIIFNDQERALIDGEGVKFAGHSTEYVISSPTDTTFVVAPVLSSNVADNEKITRLDPYRLVSFDEILDEYPEVKPTDPKAAQLYKMYLRTRKYLEERTEHVFKSRTITEVHSIDTDTDILTLKYRPVVSVTSVSTQYIGDASADTIDSDDYSVNTEQGTIYYPSGWPKGQNHITVVYVAGWSTVPFDHQQHFIELFNIRYALSPAGKDALMLSSNSKLETTARDLKDIDDYIDRNFPRPRLRL